MYKAIRVGKVITTLFFLAVLIYVYAYLPASIEVPMSFGEAGLQSISKSGLFYICTGIFGFLYLFVFLTKRLGGGIMAKEKSFVNLLNIWADSFMIVVNIYLVLALIIIGIINNKEGVVEGDYTIMAYIGPVLMLLWLLFLMVVFIKRFKVKSA